MRFARYIAIPLVSLAILTSTVAHADTTVAPGTQTNVNGNNAVNDPLIGFFNGVRTSRTFMVQFDASFVNIPVGATITGIAYRRDESNNLPTGTVTFGDYEIYLGQGTRTISDLVANSQSQSYGANMSGEQQVRDGALTVNYDAYPVGASIGSPPNAFGPEITFSSGYVYTGGSLVVYVAHNGYGTGPNSTAPVDSQGRLVPTNPGDPGYVMLRSNTDGTGTDSTNINPDLVTPTLTPSAGNTTPPSTVAGSVPIIRFTYILASAPEPGALAFVLLGGAVALVRKRRK